MLCARCGASEGDRMCENCRGVSYCSAQCQLQDWPVHRHTCYKGVEVAKSAVAEAGVFARETHAPGDELVREAPILVHSFHGDRATRRRRLSRQVSRLKKAELVALKRLVGAHPDSPAFWKKLKTNGLPVGDDAGFFPICGQANHACRPNARFIWDDERREGKLVAIRAIHAGEEVLMSYLNRYCPGAERRELLRQRFGFECTCTSCQRDTEASDDRWINIQWLIDTVPMVARFDPRRALAMSEHALHLMDQEGLDTAADKGSVHYDAYQLAGLCSEHEKAEAHLTQALLCARVADGKNSRMARACEQELLRNTFSRDLVPPSVDCI